MVRFGQLDRRFGARNRAAMVAAPPDFEDSAQHRECERQLAAAGIAREVAETARGRAEAELERLRREYDDVVHSTSWRLTYPLRRLGMALPAGLRRTLRIAARRKPGAAELDGAGEPPCVQTDDRLAGMHEPAPLLAPLPVFRVAHGGNRRVTVVSDRLAEGSDPAALLLAAGLAQRLGADLRVLTELQPGDPGVIAAALRDHDVEPCGEVQLVFSDRGAEARRGIELRDGEIFIAADWWNARNASDAVDPRRVVCVLRDEPGEEMAELLRRPGLRFAVASQMLLQRLKGQGFPGLDRNGSWFEPPVLTPAVDRIAAEIAL